MRRLIILLILGLSFTQSLYAQLEGASAPVAKKGLHGTFFVNWGYHRDVYTNSTIRFLDRQTGNYDFTFYHAKAKDQPDWDNFFKTAPTVPQYVFSAGYFFNDKHDLGIEVSWNHLKYVVRDNQTLHMKGWIDDQYYDRDTLVTRDFVHLEHTNGNNYLMISLLKRYTLKTSKNQKHKLSAVARLGGGALIPKTESNIMGKHNDGPFRFSGWVIGTGAAIHYDFFEYFFVEPSIRESFANYTDVKLYERGRAQHHFFSTQFILSAGFNFPTRRQS